MTLRERIDNLRWRFWRWNYRRTMRKAERARLKASFDTLFRAR